MERYNIQIEKIKESANYDDSVKFKALTFKQKNMKALNHDDIKSVHVPGGAKFWIEEVLLDGKSEMTVVDVILTLKDDKIIHAEMPLVLYLILLQEGLVNEQYEIVSKKFLFIKIRRYSSITIFPGEINDLYKKLDEKNIIDPKTLSTDKAYRDKFGNPYYFLASYKAPILKLSGKPFEKDGITYHKIKAEMGTMYAVANVKSWNIEYIPEKGVAFYEEEERNKNEKDYDWFVEKLNDYKNITKYNMVLSELKNNTMTITTNNKSFDNLLYFKNFIKNFTKVCRVIKGNTLVDYLKVFFPYNFNGDELVVPPITLATYPLNTNEIGRCFVDNCGRKIVYVGTYYRFDTEFDKTLQEFKFNNKPVDSDIFIYLKKDSYAPLFNQYNDINEFFYNESNDEYVAGYRLNKECFLLADKIVLSEDFLSNESMKDTTEYLKNRAMNIFYTIHQDKEVIKAVNDVLFSIIKKYTGIPNAISDERRWQINSYLDAPISSTKEGLENFSFMIPDFQTYMNVLSNPDIIDLDKVEDDFN